MKLKLLLKEISDINIRKNFEILTGFFIDQNILQNWVFLELEFTQAVTNFKARHGLTVVPKDIIQTSKTGAGSVTFNYELFDSTNLDITTTGACKVRFFVGTVQGV